MSHRGAKGSDLKHLHHTQAKYKCGPVLDLVWHQSVRLWSQSRVSLFTPEGDTMCVDRFTRTNQRCSDLLFLVRSAWNVAVQPLHRRLDQWQPLPHLNTFHLNGPERHHRRSALGYRRVTGGSLDLFISLFQSQSTESRARSSRVDFIHTLRHLKEEMILFRGLMMLEVWWIGAALIDPLINTVALLICLLLSAPGTKTSCDLRVTRQEQHQHQRRHLRTCCSSLLPPGWQPGGSWRKSRRTFCPSVRLSASDADSWFW